MRNKVLKLEGPLHPIKVKFVSQRTIERASQAKKEENIRGCYFPEENMIYVNKDMSEEEQLHVLFHEISHSIEFQIAGLEEEPRVDILAKYIITLAGFKSLKDVRWLK